MVGTIVKIDYAFYLVIDNGLDHYGASQVFPILRVKGCNQGDMLFFRHSQRELARSKGGMSVYNVELSLL